MLTEAEDLEDQLLKHRFFVLDAAHFHFKVLQPVGEQLLSLLGLLDGLLVLEVLLQELFNDLGLSYGLREAVNALKLSGEFRRHIEYTARAPARFGGST